MTSTSAPAPASSAAPVARPPPLLATALRASGWYWDGDMGAMDRFLATEQDAHDCVKPRFTMTVRELGQDVSSIISLAKAAGYTVEHVAASDDPRLAVPFVVFTVTAAVTVAEFNRRMLE